MKRLLLLLYLITSLSVVAQTNTSSISFDGVDDYIIIGDQHNFGINSSSICIRINPKNLSSSNQQNILSKSWQGGYKMDIPPNSDSLRFWLKSPSDPQEFMIYSEALTINEWVYISVVIDRLNNLSKLYLDGILVDDIDISLLGNLDNSTNLHFGSHYWLNTGQIADYYDGLIDDVHIWSIALTEQQIQDYMNCPPTGNEAGLVGYWNFEEGTGTTAGDLTSNANDGTLTNGPTWSTDVPPYNCCTHNPITSQPTDVTVPLNGTGMFSTSTSVTSSTYQWQMDNGTGYMDLTNAGQFSGVETDMLTVSNVTLGQNNTFFRCIVTENSNCSDTTDVAELTVEDNTGLEEMNQQISIYPNPTSTTFTITSKNSINSSFKLIDIQGKEVLTGKIESTEETVDISNLSKGQYNLVFEDEGISPISIIKN